VGVFGGSLERRLALSTTAPAVRQEILGQRAKLAAIVPPKTLPEPERAALKGIIDDSFTDAFRVAMLACSALAVASGLGGLVIEKKRNRKETTT
jgi:hypothetical protein